MADINAFEQPAAATVLKPLTMRRVAVGALSGGILGAGLAAHLFGFGWLKERADWHDDAFMAVAATSAAVGFVAYVVVFQMLRRVDVRVSPWLAAAAGLWSATERLVHMQPREASIYLNDPRVVMASYALLGAIVLVVVAVLRWIDWRINDEDRRERAAIEKADIFNTSAN